MQEGPGTGREARGRRAAVVMVALTVLACAAGPAAVVARPGPPRPALSADPAVLHRELCGRMDALYDTLAGGWVMRGEPLDAAIELGFARGADGDTLARGRALRTLRWARVLFDSVGGGYYSSSASMDLARPQWDKGAVANARRLRLLLTAWRATGDESWRRDAARVADFLDRVLLDGRGGFVSGQVADRSLHPGVNGEAIRSWLAWGEVTKHARQRDFTWISLDRLWSENRHSEFGMVRLDESHQVAGFPRLDDHADLGRALIASARRTGRTSDLARAGELGALVLSRFEVPGEGFRSVYQPKKGGKIARAPADPAVNARAARFLLELAAATGEVRWRDAALRALRAASSNARALERDPRAVAEWALTARAFRTAELPEPVKWATPAAPAPPKRGR